MSGLLVVVSLLAAAAPCSATLIFSDPLSDASGGTANSVRDDGNFVSLYRSDSWLKYKSLQLPSSRGTLACRINVGPNSTGYVLLSDGYRKSNGTVWPSFVLHTTGTSSTGKYGLAFYYWNSGWPGNWHNVVSGAGFDAGQWYDVGLTWGYQDETAKGQALWADGELKAADTSYVLPYQHWPGDAFDSWGLGRVYTNGDPTTGLYPASFSTLRLYDSIEEHGATSSPLPEPPVPEPTSLALLGIAGGAIGLAVKRRRRA